MCDRALDCQTLAEAVQPDPEDQARRDEVRKQITALDRELDGYRTIVRNEPDAAATVGRWITETAQKRRRLETFLGAKSTTALTKDDIKALVASLRDITATLAGADPQTKPPSTKKWESTSPTTKMAGSSSSPGRV